MKQGWLVLIFLCLIESGASANSNSIKLYVFPSRPVRIDWQDPRSLLQSMLGAILRNKTHAIGHVSVDVQCENGYHRLTGAVTEDKGESEKLLLEDKIAFSILERGWPGRLEEPDEIHEAIRKAREKVDGFSTAEFEINGPACLRVQQFLEEYDHSDHPKYYGFAARPRRHEGAGCSAFAAAVLEVAGILTPEMNQAWLRSVQIPFSLMPPRSQSPQMSIIEVLDHPDSEFWARDDVLNMNLVFYDPDLMHDWVKSFGQKKNGEPYLEVYATLAPVPTDPIFSGEPELVDFGLGTVARPQTPGQSFVLAP
ncbi:MAG: hypothetical protein AB7F86_09165 [Bdellovibrionales bacterium]